MPGNDYEPRILGLLERIMAALERIAENTAKHSQDPVTGSPQPSTELYGGHSHE